MQTREPAMSCTFRSLLLCTMLVGPCKGRKAMLLLSIPESVWDVRLGAVWGSLHSCSSELLVFLSLFPAVKFSCVIHQVTWWLQFRLSP